MNNRLPPSDVRQVAIILGLSDLSLDPNGQWQARDRYNNWFTLSDQLIHSTLGSRSPENNPNPSSYPAAEVSPSQLSKQAAA
ncbi:MAG: hypothetical protein WBA10_10855 [Elainellaceae cyanobacterium]